jgi:hypothetical protein
MNKRSDDTAPAMRCQVSPRKLSGTKRDIQMNTEKQAFGVVKRVPGK